ncbi:MAG: methionyl-tRNA formyltransferase [Desulfovibrio sp.]|nr:methionyl-tRNA formyltransferase [Desulfovibrio sp.]
MDAQAKKYRIVFMGTPPFAVRILEHLANWPHGEIVAVYTQPDRPAKRGKKLCPSAVKEAAIAHDFPVLQPFNFKDQANVQQLAALHPDFLVVAAYGQILPANVLAIPVFPPLNVHASLLPKYRGAAPVQRAIMENYGADAQTGVSIMQMVEALDAGPVFLQKAIAIGEKTSDELFEEIAELGGKALLEVLLAFLEGKAQSLPQDDSQASYAPKIDKSAGVVHWDATFDQVHAQIRAVTSVPGARTVLTIDQTHSYDVFLLPGRRGSLCSGTACGSVRFDDEGLAIACSDYWYRVDKVKPQGKAFMSSKSFANGYLRKKSN